jgi:hypothetical protein
VLGNAEASSAQTSAPKKVRTPLRSQTSNMPPIEGTCRVISDRSNYQ